MGRANEHAFVGAGTLPQGGLGADDVGRVGERANLVIRPGRPGAGAGAQLVDAFVRELEVLYEPGFTTRTPSAAQHGFDPPAGSFLVAYEDGRAVACGGLKRLSVEVAEIKRLFVVPEARGRGAARWLLGVLEATARDLGYKRVRLDTGAHQPRARALFESAGFRAIPDYNDNPYASFWAEKAL